MAHFEIGECVDHQIGVAQMRPYYVDEEPLLTQKFHIEGCVVYDQSVAADKIDNLRRDVGETWFVKNHGIVEACNFRNQLWDGMLRIEDVVQLSTGQYAVDHLNTGDFNNPPPVFGCQARCFSIQKYHAHGGVQASGCVGIGRSMDPRKENI